MRTLYPSVSRFVNTPKKVRFVNNPSILSWRIPTIVIQESDVGILTEDGIALTTEDGQTLVTE